MRVISHDEAAPTVAVIIPMMDRAADLEASLPSLLRQDYPNYRVFIIDMGSRDELDAVLGRHACPALERVRCARPKRFSFSKARNIGARASTGDLLLFLNGDNAFTSPAALSDILRDLRGSDADPTWFGHWRKYAGYAPLVPAPGATVSTSGPRRYAHCHGSPLLLERTVFEQLGGYNELLEDWGYEDTDLIARLELAGFSRVEMPGVGVVPVADEEEARVRHFASRNREMTWARNRLISDFMIRTWGVAFATAPRPGSSGLREVPAPRHGEWIVEAPLTDAEIEWIGRTRTRYSSMSADDLTRRDATFPRVTVLVLAHGDEAALRQTLTSIRLQEYPCIETIVIDRVPAVPLAETGVAFERRVQEGRAPFAVPPSDWMLGSGEVLAWINAGDVWDAGAARVAVSHLLTHDDTPVLETRLAAPDATGAVEPEGGPAPGTHPGEEPLPRGLTRWAHRLRLLPSPQGNPDVARQITDWFARESQVTREPSDGWMSHRCLVTLTYEPVEKVLRVSAVSVDRDISGVTVSIDRNIDASGAPDWTTLGVFPGAGRTLEGAVRLRHKQFHRRECRLSVGVDFADGTAMLSYEQPAWVLRLPKRPPATPP